MLTMNLSNNPFSLNLTLMQLIFAIIMYSLIAILLLLIEFKSNKVDTFLNDLSDKIFKLFKK